MKQYDLSYSYFFSFLLNFKSGFLRCQNRETLVAVGLNWDLNVVPGPQVVTQTYFDFFLYFFLPCLSFNLSVPLVK